MDGEIFAREHKICKGQIPKDVNLAMQFFSKHLLSEPGNEFQVTVINNRDLFVWDRCCWGRFSVDLRNCPCKKSPSDSIVSITCQLLIPVRLPIEVSGESQI